VDKDRLYWEEEAPKKSRRLRRLERERKERRAGFTELVLTVVVAFVLVFGLVRPYVAEAYRIPTESMVPTLEVGDRVLANKFIYRFTEPEKGDIVVFDSVDEEDDQTLIKRVVGVAGDKIEVQGGVLFVNGEEQEEPYLNNEEVPFGGSYGPTEVPEGHVFVMGDNRGNSADSRVFGPLPLENLKGEAFMVFWPVSKIEIL
jgi:signal peptidase I